MHRSIHIAITIFLLSIVNLYAVCTTPDSQNHPSTFTLPSSSDTSASPETLYFSAVFIDGAFYVRKLSSAEKGALNRQTSTGEYGQSLYAGYFGASQSWSSRGPPVVV